MLTEIKTDSKIIRKILDTKMVFTIFAKNIIMTVVSIRDFRANQSKYLGLAAGGESVILTSRTGSFKIVPITEDDSLVSKKEFFARLDEARKSIAEGKGTSVSGKEELDSLLASL
jgi:antitoxin (DNA-binding transcriptional repressor) of toxin-antitoxin stability system